MVKASKKGVASTNAAIQAAANGLGDNAVVLINNGAIAVAYDDTSCKFYRAPMFVVRTLYADKVSGGYLPGKGVGIPLHHKAAFIAAIKAQL